jgi:Mrp family chromosome partitioning ATPase
VTQLRSKVDGLQKLFDDANTKMMDIGRINITLKSHRTELARLEDDFELTNSRIEQLTLEGSESGRISILSEAEVPGSPSNEKRRMQLVILGGLAGAGLGVALVMGLGFLKSNIRDITDAQAIQPRMLGALPLLPQTLGSTSEVISAAHSVHHIRTILHAHMPPHESLCLTVTASNSGAGKTSFALSLGISFATAGTRTLIIDGDVIGTGLTRRTGATGRRKLGHVLRTYEVITEEESRHALQVARQTGRPIGHALIELGYISENDLQDGLAMQKDVGLGLADALNGEHVENCLADIGVPGLTILPSSRRTVANSHTMSPVAFRKLLDELRPMFDIILIDSGPVPGLSDAMIMCMCADGVIIMASRGDSETDVQRALKHLNELTVPVVGLVFNRADAMDLERSKFSSSSVSSNGREKPTQVESGNADADIPWAELLEPVAGFGPLAQSVWLSTTHATSMNPTEVSA